jgi:hypothetical protein
LTASISGGKALPSSSAVIAPKGTSKSVANWPSRAPISAAGAAKSIMPALMALPGISA